MSMREQGAIGRGTPSDSVGISSRSESRVKKQHFGEQRHLEQKDSSSCWQRGGRAEEASIFLGFPAVQPEPPGDSEDITRVFLHLQLVGRSRVCMASFVVVTVVCDGRESTG